MTALGHAALAARHAALATRHARAVVLQRTLVTVHHGVGHCAVVGVDELQSRVALIVPLVAAVRRAVGGALHVLTRLREVGVELCLQRALLPHVQPGLAAVEQCLALQPQARLGVE